MTIDRNFIEDVKEKLNIVDIIGKDVKLAKKGRNYSGLCPFHNEKTPSFSVNEDGQYYHCFGCNRGGDVIKFIEEYYHLNFNEAVEKLCDDNGIEMPERRVGKRTNYGKYYEINKKTARFYFDRLRDKSNPGYSYIHNRGISDRWLNRFGIGYAAPAWNDLYNYLSSNGISDDDMLKLGLVKRSKMGTVYDKFRNRIIFPIFNTKGNVIGFGGRSISSEKNNPKYINSDESDIFSKKNNLYALNFAKQYIRDEGKVLIVEGYMDVLSLHQAGICNVVASLGTALTEEQSRLIGRYASDVILSYDADDAGINAAVRGTDIMRHAGCNVKILRIKDGKDPDEFVNTHGSAKFRKLIDCAQPWAELRLEILERDFDLGTDSGVMGYLSACAALLKELNPVEIDIYARRLSEKFGVSAESIIAEVKTYEPERPARNHLLQESGVVRGRSRKAYDNAMMTELLLLCIGAADTEYIRVFAYDSIEFNTDLGKKVYDIEVGLFEKDPSCESIDLHEISDSLEPDEERALTKAAKDILVGGDIKKYYTECRSRYFLNKYNDLRLKLGTELEVAEKMGDEDARKLAAKKLVQITDKIKSLKGDRNGKKEN